MEPRRQHYIALTHGHGHLLIRINEQNRYILNQIKKYTYCNHIPEVKSHLIFPVPEKLLIQNIKGKVLIVTFSKLIIS